MKNKILLFSLLFCLLSASAWAQKMSIRGVLQDSLSQPLEFATVMLLNKTDSSLINFGRSNIQGAFELKNINANDYILKITFVGFQNYVRAINSNDAPLLDLGVITMKSDSRLLKDIVIEGEKNPITIKRDTIEFNAGSFATKPNATVEDLLKRLPGVEVERDGTVKVQGETVQRVLVEGKEFFGRDPKIATKNLPADAVDKLQIFDQKSEQAIFSGVDDGTREKTINITLKDKNKKSYFGNVMAGLGTDERYESKLSLNRFATGAQFSVLGMGNNINERGFGVEDYLNFSGNSVNVGRGGGGRIGGGGNSIVPVNFGGQPNGIMETWAGGVNFNKQFSPKTELNTSYFYNNTNLNLQQNLIRQNFLPTGDLIFTQNSFQNDRNSNHRLNMTLDHKIDSVNSLRLTANMSYAEKTQTELTENQNTNAEGNLLNEGENLNRVSGNGLTLNTNLLYRHRFRKKGRTISSNILFRLNDQSNNGFLESSNTFFQFNPRTDVFDQRNSQDNLTYTYGGNVSYTEPLGKRKYLELNYTYNRTKDDVNRGVFDRVNDSEENFNFVLSNQFKNEYDYHRGGLNFKLNQKKYNFSTGLSIQNTRLEGFFPLLESEVKRDFTNLLPTVRFNYDFSSFKRLNFDYETNVNEPSITQLQPVIDNRDPLNIYVGNPTLRPAFQHRIRANYFSFDAIKFVNFFASFNANYSTNTIINAQLFDEQGIRTTTPRNVQDNLIISSNINFGFPIKKLKSRINIGTNTAFTDGFNFVNDVEAKIKQSTLGGRANYEFNIDNVMTIVLSANLRHQASNFDFDRSRNQRFLNQTYTTDANFTLPLGFNLNTIFEHFIYNSTTTDFEQIISLWNISLSKFFLKGQAGELKLTVNNLLNQNVGANQEAQINFLEQTTVQNLGRYFMLSFTYNLNKALNPAAGMNGAGRGRGGQMMRIIR